MGSILVGYKWGGLRLVVMVFLLLMPHNRKAQAEEHKDEAEGGWRVEGSGGLHLSIPNAQLAETTGIVGGGMHLAAGGAPRNLPFLLEISLGLDGYLPFEAEFAYEDNRRVWSIKRRSFWMMPSFRLIPPKGIVRPYLGVAGGAWFHDVVITGEGDWGGEIRHNLGIDVTGAYGASVGLDWRMGRKVRMGLSLRYLRGGSITIPNYLESEVIDGGLFIPEWSSGAISQWMIGVEVGAIN